MTKGKPAARRVLTHLLPYAGIPVLCAVLLIYKAGGLNVFGALKYEILIIIGYAAAICDIRTKTIPNKAVLALLVMRILLLTPELLTDADAAVIGAKDAALGFAVGGGLFLIVYVISRKGLGGGDVKFMAASGLYLGVGGTLTSMLSGAVFAALTGSVLLIMKKAGRKDTMPLAPFLFAGMMIAVFAS